jgi:RHS repeat-associated protein
VPSASRAACTRLYSRARWNCQYSSKSPLARSERRRSAASAPLSRPPRSGHLHPVFDQIPAGTFDHAGRNRQPGGQIFVTAPTAVDGSGTITNWALGADTYLYDELNRITRVTETYQNYAATSFKQSYLYDRYGNRTIDLANTDNVGGGVTRLDFKALTATNRLVAQSDTTGDDPGSDQMRYDKAGNLIYDNFSPATGQRGTMTYDAENHLVTAVNGTQRYRYDANGRRVKRQVGQAGEVWQVYSPDGELLAEYPQQGAAATPTKEYGYRGGQLLVVFDSTEAAADDKLKWLVTDHLGSTRMLVNRSGSLAGIKRRDYLPFGEELAATIGHRAASGSGYQVDDKPRMKFGAYERDSETGLDFAEARYCGSVQGRFTSVDPFLGSARRWVPQSWNRYSYVINNPLKYTDPNGLVWIAGRDGSTFWDGEVTNADEVRKKYGKGFRIIDGQTRVITGSNDPRFIKGHSYTFNPDGTITDHGVYTPPPPPELPRTNADVQVAKALAELYGAAALTAITGGGATVGAAAVGAAEIMAGYLLAVDEEPPDQQTLAMAASNVQANRAAGDAFRDLVADALEKAGRVVEKEKTFDTPFGPRRVDIHVKDASGNVLGGVETKVGGSRYRASQRAKDAYLRIFKKYIVHVVRRR